MISAKVAIQGSDKLFDLMDPDPAMINIKVIGNALSNICRFAGQVPVFYSVAEHSVLVCDLLKLQNYSPSVQLAGLLHDAAEAFTGELISPIKQLDNMDSFHLIEHYVEAAIETKFGVELHSQGIKDADLEALYFEGSTFFPGAPWLDEITCTQDIKGEPLEIYNLSPDHAYERFMERYADVIDRIQQKE